jgi:DNA-binding MurR/RpiR family transcriptional regulator
MLGGFECRLVGHLKRGPGSDRMAKNSKRLGNEGASVATLLSRLKPKRQEIIRPVIEHPRDYVLLSIRALAKKLDTEPATTLRIIQDMGFSAYREFQHYLHELSIAQATPLDLMKMTSTEDSDIPAHLREVVNRDLKNLQILRQGLDFGRIAGLAKKLYDARRILIIGGDLARNLVGFLQYNLMLLGLPVFTALTAGEAVHATRAVSKGDLVIAISFRRGLRQTVEGLQQARNNGAYCVGISDTYISPIARFSNECFLASIDSPSFGGSYAAPMTLMNILIVACAHYRRDRTLALLKKAEKEQRTGFRWYSED